MTCKQLPARPPVTPELKILLAASTKGGRYSIDSRQKYTIREIIVVRKGSTDLVNYFPNLGGNGLSLSGKMFCGQKKRPSSAAAPKFMSKTWDLGCSRGVASCLLGTSWGNLVATNPCNRGRKIFNLISTSFCTFCPLGSAQSQ